ncbi:MULTISPECIES: hypothetical protein [Paenibacillus]|uniref:hypothetical protein n=1 Tax=Paenibacillus TaxID=44249 RepID=UPI0022B8F988|nr:hypothetical protein [Paenibacillus caseinilyticus]MCZ8522912.1 hypothetical protein [Paenibacillus caseinilyticus]
MTRKRTLPTIMKPFSQVHSTLTALGFSQISLREGAAYEIKFRDPATLKEYPYRLYTYTQENGQTLIDVGEAGFVTPGGVPMSAEVSAEQVMSEVLQYLEGTAAKRKSTPIDRALNGMMATNEEEVKKLGKSMVRVQTNAQLIEAGLIPDPIQ